MHKVRRWTPLVLSALLSALLIACGPGSGGDPNTPTAVMRALHDLPASSLFAGVPARFAPGGRLATEADRECEIPEPAAPTRVDRADPPAVAGSFWGSLEDLSLLPIPFGSYVDALCELPSERRVEEGEPVAIGAEAPLGRLSVAARSPPGRLSVAREGVDAGGALVDRMRPRGRLRERADALAHHPGGGWGAARGLARDPRGSRNAVRLDAATGESLDAQLNPAAEQGVNRGYLSISEAHGGQLLNRARGRGTTPGSIPDVQVAWTDADAAEVEGWWVPGGFDSLETAEPGSSGCGVYDAWVDIALPNRSIEFAVPASGALRSVPIFWGPSRLK